MRDPEGKPANPVFPCFGTHAASVLSDRERSFGGLPVGTEREVMPFSMDDEFAALCKRLSGAQDQGAFFAALDEVTAYLTRKL